MHTLEVVPRRRDARRLPVTAVMLVLVPLVAVTAVLSTGFGAEPLPAAVVVDVLQHRVSGAASNPAYDAIVWEIRLPRTLLALIVGAGLAVAGAGIQTLVRNPLADPYLLGVSSGASVGATAVITLGVLAGVGLWAGAALEHWGLVPAR